MSELVGDQVFAGVGQRDTAPGSAPVGSGGVTIAFNASANSYTLSAPVLIGGGTITGTFVSADIAATSSNTTVWDKTSGTVRDVFALVRPSVGGVPLSYTNLAQWLHNDSSDGTKLGIFYLATGVPTKAGDVPVTGTATYGLQIFGSAAATPPGGASLVQYNFVSASSGALNMDFANNQLTGKVHFIGTPQTGSALDFGNADFSGFLLSNPPDFSGSLSFADAFGSSQGIRGSFYGSFFGPQAQELGLAYFFGSGIIGQADGRGMIAGVKQ